ncbi:MAG: hypothetical protein R3F61_34285 [Myxococcota bacterium]
MTLLTLFACGLTAPTPPADSGSNDTDIAPGHVLLAVEIKAFRHDAPDCYDRGYIEVPATVFAAFVENDACREGHLNMALLDGRPNSCWRTVMVCGDAPPDLAQADMFDATNAPECADLVAGTLPNCPEDTGWGEPGWPEDALVVGLPPGP